MHTFRLLEMAIEIGKSGQIHVERPNREFLLAIKSGQYEYDDLMKMADERKQQMEEVFTASSLPDSPDRAAINELLYSLREKYYSDLTGF